MHLKVFLKLKKPKNSLFWANISEKPKKPPPKNQKKTKKNHWASFFLNPGFFQPGYNE
jgi:hypothetical protein